MKLFWVMLYLSFGAYSVLHVNAQARTECHRPLSTLDALYGTTLWGPLIIGYAFLDEKEKKAIEQMPLCERLK